MDYIQNTSSDVSAMLQAIGVGSIEDLFASIPPSLRLKRPLELPPPLSEPELQAHLESLAARNRVFESGRCFLGAGLARRFVPAVVDALGGRAEFVTAYTPYQAEASQGTLQHIFEFQTMICELTALDVANASHYDGATAAQEALAMAVAHTGRPRVVLSAALHPHYRSVIRTLFRARGIQILEVAHVHGATPVSTLRAAAEGAAGVVLQNPNFFGCLEDLEGAARAAHEAGALAVAVVEPFSLTLLKPPGECGCDIAAGEAQPLGGEPSFGGPGCGFLAARREFLRRMPGRIVGQTLDAEGRRGFVLTLQTREQHIRREKASSNICTNQTLMALRAAIAMSALGPRGIRRAAELSVLRAHELAERLEHGPASLKLSFRAPFFNEFVLRIPRAASVLRYLLDQGFLAGLDLQPFGLSLRDHVLLSCTELHTPEDLENFAAALEKAVRILPTGTQGN